MSAVSIRDYVALRPTGVAVSGLLSRCRTSMESRLFKEEAFSSRRPHTPGGEHVLSFWGFNRSEITGRRACPPIPASRAGIVIYPTIVWRQTRGARWPEDPALEVPALEVPAVEVPAFTLPGVREVRPVHEL